MTAAAAVVHDPHEAGRFEHADVLHHREARVLGDEGR
jgi:hypothetical protein